MNLREPPLGVRRCERCGKVASESRRRKQEQVVGGVSSRYRGGGFMTSQSADRDIRIQVVTRTIVRPEP